MKRNGIRKFEVVARANGEAEIFLYDQIGASFFDGGISAKQFADEFRAVSAKASRIVLRINSPGGDVFDGAAIYDYIAQSDTPVDVVIDGLAASAAFTVAMAGRSIAIGEAGMMMMHNAKGMVFGDAEDMRGTASIVEKITNQMAAIYAKRSGAPMADVLADMDSETWMTPEDAVAKGYADKIIASAEPEDLAAHMAAAFENLKKFNHVPKALEMRIAALATPKQIPVIHSRPQAHKEIRIMEQAPETPATSSALVVKDPYGPVAADIMEMGREHKIDVLPLIQREAPLAEAKEWIADERLAKYKRDAFTSSGPATETVQSLSEKDRNRYSIARAILSQADNRRETALLEWEVSDAITKAMGKEPRNSGMFIPTNLKGDSSKLFRPQAAGLDTKSNAAGKYTVPTEVRDFLELLRNRMMVFQLGATILSGLNGNIQFPRQLTGMTAFWVTENPGTDVTQTDVTFGALTLSPKTLQATTSYSRQLLAQASIDIENLVRNELATIHALAIDLAAINGLGASNQPTGLLRTSGIGDVPIGAAGGAPTYDFIVDVETKVAQANGDVAGMKWLTTPVMRGKLRKIQMFTGTNGMPLWNPYGNTLGVGDLLGYPAYVSNQVPSTLTKGASTDCHAIIFAYWPTVMVGEWGTLELVVDPYALKKQGMIEVTSFQLVDVGVRYPAQVAAIQDARNI